MTYPYRSFFPCFLKYHIFQSIEAAKMRLYHPSQHSYAGLPDNNSYPKQIKQVNKSSEPTLPDTASAIGKTPKPLYVVPSWLVLSPRPPLSHNTYSKRRNKRANDSSPKAAPADTPMERWQNESIRDAPWNIFVMSGEVTMAGTDDGLIQDKSRDEVGVEIELDVDDGSSTAASFNESTKAEHGSMDEECSEGTVRSLS